MIRNRFSRFPLKGGRNLQNLHVIPTALVENIELKQLNPAVIQITPTEDLNSANKTSLYKNTNPGYGYKRRKNKRQRKRQALSANNSVRQNSNNLCAPDFLEPVASPLGNTEKEPEKMESTPDFPVEDNYFEEVEVASVEAESKQEILVRFRKTKLCYLKYRRTGLFKPKFYKIAEPTFVNCLNVQEDVDVDIVSEAEYEYETDCLDRNDSPDMFNKILEVDDSDVDDDEKTEEEMVQDKKTEEKKVVQGEKIEEKILVQSEKPEEKKMAQGDKTKEKVVQDADSASEPSVNSTKRVYKTCVEGNNDFIQGISLIQDNLDSWKSHLIGLEYLIEIQNTDRNSVVKYHCGLCLEDIQVQALPGVCVISHISSYKHVVKYLEKHFPACGYKFTENTDYNISELGKLAEEINRNVGYYFMCISNSEYYRKNKQNINEIIKKAHHPNEKDFVPDKNLILQKIDSNLKDDVKNIVSNVVEKAAFLKEDVVSSEVNVKESIPKNTLSSSEISVSNADSVEIVDVHNDKKHTSDTLQSKSKKGKKCTLYKGNNPLTSYMALSDFASFAFKSTKKKPKVAAKASDVNVKKKELIDIVPEIVQNVGSEVVGNVSCKSKETEKTNDPGSETFFKPEDEKNVCMENHATMKDHIDIKDNDRADIKDNDHADIKENPAAVEDVEHEVSGDVDHETVEEMDHESVENVNHEAREDLSPEIFENEDPEAGECEQHEDDPEVASSTEILPTTNQKDHKTKEKVLLKTGTVHSKYCRKRILGKASSRLKLSVQGTTKAASGISKKCSVKHKSVGHDTFNEIVETNKEQVKVVKTNKENVKIVKTAKSSSLKRIPEHKIISVQKTPLNSKPSLTKHSSSHKIIHKKEDEDSSDQIIKKTPSVWKPVARTSRSPVKSTTTDSSRPVKSPGRKQSRSPARRTVRRISKSPTRRIKSPIKHVLRPSIPNPFRRHSKSPTRKHSRSPLKRKSRSPIRRKSRSPIRRKSRSPIRRKSRSPMRRRSRSPLRRNSRSPIRRKSRSPIRRKSRSPIRRKSRSPIRRKSRSPMKRKSRSPIRRKSRSPLRRYSRSPLRRRSRSPLRRRSRSPLRRRSRSPLRRRSRSPLRHRSRSLLRHRSRSPVRRYSRSPLRRQSRSPVRRHSRSSLSRYSRSPVRCHSRSSIRYHSRSPFKYHSRSPIKNRSITPDRRHSRSPIENISKILDKYRNSQRVNCLSHSLQKHFNAEKRTSSYEKHSGCVSEFSKSKESSSKRITSEKFKSQSFPHSSSRGISDLDPVSDEDESIYFNDKNPCGEDVISPPPKIMLAKLLQKFSMADVNPNDPALNKLLQFMEAHSSEIQNLIGPQPKSDNIGGTKLDSSLQERRLFLQQYLLTNLAGGNQDSRLSSPVSSMQSKFERPPFLHGPLGLVHPTNVPPPTISQPVQQRFFPPNITVPPPQIFHQLNQPHQDFSPKLNVPPEIMFKDLKATVSKLFGANESVMKQEKPKIPGYVTEPDPEKWDLNHPDTLKHNTSIGSTTMFNLQEKNIEYSNIPQNPVTREEIPMYNNNNSGQFLGGRGITRPQISSVPIPPPDAKVSFCEVSRGLTKGNLFPVVNAHPNQNFNAPSSCSGVSDVKVSLAQRLASVLVKVGMIDVPAPLLQEMLMKIGAFSSSPRQDISESEIISILKRLGYLS